TTVVCVRYEYGAVVEAAANRDAVIHHVADYVAEGTHLISENQVVTIRYAKVEIAIGVHAAGETEVGTLAVEEVGIRKDAELEYRNQCYFRGTRHAHVLAGVALGLNVNTDGNYLCV